MLFHASSFVGLAAVFSACLGAAPLSAQVNPPDDELLVSAFTSSGVTRHGAQDGSFELDYGPSPLAGTLGASAGPDGAVYVCSETSNEVLRFDPLSGAYLGTFIADDPATSLDETGGLAGPAGIVFGDDGYAYVASFNSDAVLRYDARSGAFDSVFVSPNEGNLNGPDAGLAFEPGGDLLVPSYFTHHVKRFDPNGDFVGNFTSFPASGVRNPRTVLVAEGLVYVTSEGTDAVLELASDGTFLRELIADDPATAVDESGGLDGPTGIAIGPDGRLYVASVGTDEVLRFERDSGAFVDVFVTAGAGGIVAPTFVAFRPRVGTYCDGAPNSVGAGGAVTATGFTSVASGSFGLEASFCPPGEVGLFLHGPEAAATPLGGGTLCVGGDLCRLPLVTISAAGGAGTAVDLSAEGLLPGTTRHFQFWYRDGASSNLTNALRTTFHP